MAHMFDYKTKVHEQLQHLPTDLATLSSTEIAPTMALLRAIEGLLVGAITTVTNRASELEKQGRGDPVHDVLQAGGKISSKQARIQAARASVTESFPVVGHALTTGSATPENIDILTNTTRNLTDHEKQALAQADTEIAQEATTMSPDLFAKATRRRIRQIRSEAGMNTATQAKVNSYARTGLNTGEGMQYLNASFDPSRGAEITKALDWKTRSIAKRDGTRSESLEINDNLRAQALYELITDGVSYHDSEKSTCSGGRAGGVHRIPSVSVITDLRTLTLGPHPGTISETWAGTPLPPQTLARLCCDARITEIVIGPKGEPLDVGREFRSATDAQRKMLRAMYGGCAITGDSFDRCHMHHVQFWADEGPTDLNNLVPINQYWHHLVHEGSWTLTMGSDRTLTLRRPNDTLYKIIRPPGPLPPSEAAALLLQPGVVPDPANSEPASSEPLNSEPVSPRTRSNQSN